MSDFREEQVLIIERNSITPRLSVRVVNKSFPGVKALSGVSFEVLSGEVHALCGENGAGKSTLMRIIAGVETPDEGEVLLNGQSIVGIDEQTAIKLGIGMVHQERSLVPGLSIAENVFAGRQPTNRFGVIDWSTMYKRTKEILKNLKVELDPKTMVSDLSPAQEQMVEIAKALSQQLQVLILDEPTAALTITETEHLFEVVRHLTQQGVSVVYISHRLAEIFEICDRVTVMKDGEVTGVHSTSDIVESDLIRLMVGREVLFAPDVYRTLIESPYVLKVESLRSTQGLVDGSLSIKAGEIVCLAGLVGAGRTELCETIFGVRPRLSGRILIEGKEVDIRHPADAMMVGIGMVPEDRKISGLFLEKNLAENIAAANLKVISNQGVVSERISDDIAKSYVEKLRIATPHIHQPVVNLSGGNQQKVLLAKWLVGKPKILIVDEPTRGVDVGAREDIYNILRQLAREGTALLVVSSDLPEVLALAHRIVVMSEGRTVGEIDAAQADEITILQMAAPGSRKGENIA